MFICDQQTSREEQDEEKHTHAKSKLHFERPWIIKANISTLNPENSINAMLGFFWVFLCTRSVQNAQFEALRVNARKKLIRDPRLKCRDLSILSHTDKKNPKHDCPVGLQGGAEQSLN